MLHLLFVLVLEASVTRCDTQELQHTTSNHSISSEHATLGTLTIYTRGSLVDDAGAGTGAGASGRRSNSLVENLRRKLMSDNYDYTNKDSDKHIASSTAPPTPTTTTTAQSPTTAETTDTAPDIVTTTSIDYDNHAKENVGDIDVQIKSIAPSVVEVSTETTKQPTFSISVGHHQYQSFNEAYNARNLPQARAKVAPGEPELQVHKEDLLYYMDDEQLRKGFNFRRNNDVSANSYVEEREEDVDYSRTEHNSMQDDVDATVDGGTTIPPDVGNSSHYRRRGYDGFQRRNNLYNGFRNVKPIRKRIYKRDGRGNRIARKRNRQKIKPRATKKAFGRDYQRKHPQNGLRKRPQVSQRNIHKTDRRKRRYGVPKKIRQRWNRLPKPPYRREEHDDKKGNQPKNNIDQQYDQRDENINDKESMPDDKSDGRREYEGPNEQIQDKKRDVKQDSLSEDNNDFNGGGVSQHSDQRDDQPNDEQFESRRSNALHYNQHEEETHSTPNAKYKLLKVRSAGGSRRSGAAERALLQERKAAGGVSLIALDAAPFPQFRLPRARRQYMHERAHSRPPLHDQLPRAHSISRHR